MLQREIIFRIHQLLREFPAVALLGPRQSGKTTLARMEGLSKKKQVVYLDLERPADLRRLDDLELFFSQHRRHFVIIDEIQNKPEVFSYLRHEIDAMRQNGRFLLTGSASPELVKGVSESLAGRIYYLEMQPVNLTEALKAGISQQKHWLRGGFPEALLARNNGASMRWRESFIRSYAERDLSALFGVGISAPLVRNFWSMLAGQQGAVFNSQNFARSLGVSAPTVHRYLDLLEGAFLLRKLPAWFVNANKRLVKAPKLYIRDSGLLHYFGQIEKQEDLPGHMMVGASWEGYVIEEICRKLPAAIQPFYYRTHQGAEADLILVRGLKVIAVIEIKFSLQPALTKGFYEVLKDLGQPASFVVMPSGTAYRNKEGSRFLNCVDFLQKELPRLIS
jgi:hypothetical protein